MRARKLTILFISILAGIVFVTNVLAVDVKPYVKIGGMELIEKGISEGHKSFGLLGINVIRELGKAELTGTLEGFVMTEAVDEDPELLHNGFRTGIEYKYSFNVLNPYAGVYFENWNRDSNSKYPDSFTRMDFAEATFGFTAKKKYVYARVGGIYPFWADVGDYNPHGKLGFEASIGFEFRNFNIGYSYKRISFTDLEFNFSCAEIGYRF